MYEKLNSIVRYTVLSAVAVSALLLVSCLTVDTEIKLNKDGTVDAELIYILSSGSADFGRGFGSDEPWLLPLTEKDFQLQSLRVPEVQIVRYRVKESSDGSELIEVKLQAESLEALAAYLDLDIDYSADNGSRILVLSFPGSEDFQSADEQTRAVLQEMAGDSVFRFVFQPPSSPVSVNTGLIDGRSALLEISFATILSGSAPELWEIRW